MAKATASPPAKRHSGDRPRGKAKTPKHKTKETSPPRIKSARKHENKPGLRSPFLLTRLVHYLAALWHILSPPLTANLSKWRDDLSTWLSRELLDAAVITELPSGRLPRI
jgi:hypothetical protein